MGIYLSDLLPHTLPHISSECVVFQSSEVFPTRHVCVVRGCYISAETSLAEEAELHLIIIHASPQRRCLPPFRWMLYPTLSACADMLFST